MTRTKKTLGRNWTRYHNYYSMNHVLERACSKKLHWNRETIHKYTVSHAPDVNHQNAMQYVNNPPPLPDNDDDDWFRHHPKLPGSGKALRKQLKPKVQKKKVKHKAVGRHCQLLSREQGNLADTGQAQWPYEKSGGTRNLRNCSSGSCHSRGWCRNLLKTWASHKSVSRVGHHSTTRGLGGLFGGPPRGLQPLCHPCEEGHNHAKRHSVGTPHQRGEELTALTGITKNLVLFGTTTSSKRCIPMKAIPKYQKSIK